MLQFYHKLSMNSLKNMDFVQLNPTSGLEFFLYELIKGRLTQFIIGEKSADQFFSFLICALQYISLMKRRKTDFVSSLTQIYSTAHYFFQIYIINLFSHNNTPFLCHFSMFNQIRT